MTEDQLHGWIEYAEVEPWGEERADLRAGIIASIVANVNRDPKKGKPFSPSDFMPKFSETGENRGDGSGGHGIGHGSRSHIGERKPLTDPAAWNRFKSLVVATAKAR